MEASFREIAQQMDPVRPPKRLRGDAKNSTEETNRGLFEIHRWQPHDIEQRHSFRSIVNRHSGQETTRHRFLWYNTWLLPPIKAFGFIGSSGKPALEQRASELGQRLEDHSYDIVALGEVFTESAANLIRAGRSPSEGWGPTSGVAGTGLGVLSSGLWTLNFEKGITARETKVFSVRGVDGVDADVYANKGVLLTEIDVGVGTIDLYSTHMYSGGGLLDPSPIVGTEITQTLRDGFRRSQITELVDFIEETHDPEHVAVIAGDFNVSAKKTSEYDYLLGEMSRINCTDIWKSRGGKVGGTAHDPNDENLREYTVCSFDPTVPPQEQFCDDFVTENASEDPRRIDYIFVEEPRDEHIFNLDFTRIRRRPFWRGNKEPFSSKSDPSKFSSKWSLCEVFSDDALIEQIAAHHPVLNEDNIRLAIDELGVTPTQFCRDSIGQVINMIIPHYISDHLGLEVELIASK